MNKLLLLLLFIPSLSFAQKVNKGTAYLGLMLHEDQIGGGLLLSYSAHKFIGLGAGVDISTYDEELIVPAYIDLQIKYPVSKFTPFINGQIGKQIYRKKNPFNYVDPRDGDDRVGQYFYGAGAGLAYKLGKVGIFLRYTYRDYKFKMEGTTPENRPYKLITNEGMNIITFGITL